jgi:hypothetical protein
MFDLAGLQGALTRLCACKDSNCALLGSNILNMLEWMAKVLRLYPGPQQSSSGPFSRQASCRMD